MGNDKDLTMREMLRQNYELLQEHKAESDKFRESLLVKVAKIETHNDYARKKMSDHETDLQKLKDSEKHRKGFVKGILVLGILYLGDLLKRIFNL